MSADNIKKVSVILTAFNGEKTVERALTSFLKQRGINEKFTLEIIVIDDYSSDN